MERIDRSTYTTTNFVEWRESKSLDIVPKFQRRTVWSIPAKSYFIDTLIRNFPVPPIYLRVRRGTSKAGKAGWVYEVVDGQQRISSVLDFIDGKYPLSRALDAPYAAKSFHELSATQQAGIEQYGFYCQVMHGVSDAEVLQIFARLNTYTVKLNRQELRNGQYFGHFKQSAYGLAYSYVEFWRQHRIFSETSMARMLEVELTSELLAAQLGGIQDKKRSLDKYYADYDEEFRLRGRMEQRFGETIGAISEALGSELGQTEFHRAPLFYSLYCAVYHRLFGLPQSELSRPKHRPARSDWTKLHDAVVRLSNIVDDAREDGEVAERWVPFVNACLRQTDNIGPRRTRMEVVYQQAF